LRESFRIVTLRKSQGAASETGQPTTQASSSPRVYEAQSKCLMNLEASTRVRQSQATAS